VNTKRKNNGSERTGGSLFAAGREDAIPRAALVPVECSCPGMWVGGLTRGTEDNRLLLLSPALAGSTLGMRAAWATCRSRRAGMTP
jgi:hypothetical protein